MVAVYASSLAALAFSVAMIQAALGDLTTLQIKNRLVLMMLLGYAVLAPLAGFSLSDIAQDSAAAAAVFVGAFIFFVMGWIGGGDAKLATVTALWVGADQTVAYLVYAAVIGGGLTLLLLQFRGLVLPAPLIGRAWVRRLHSAESGVPYGVALAAAGLIIFHQTAWAAHLPL